MDMLWVAAKAEMTREGCWAASLNGAASAAHIPQVMAHDSEDMMAWSHSPDSHCSHMQPYFDCINREEFSIP